MTEIIQKSRDDIEIMRQAGRIVAHTLAMVEANVRPGITTGELNDMVDTFIRERNAIPAFKDYQGYPASACISIDEEVVHGIPGKRALQEGQIVSVDVGAIYDGFYGDAAATFAVGKVSAEKARLMDVTRSCLQAGIDKVRTGNKLGQISAAVQGLAEREGFSVVRQLVGHGIGRKMHEEPQVPNYGFPDDGPVLETGVVLAIEPMINMGAYEVKTMPDGWTFVTVDGLPSAHFEHTVAVTDDGPDILTLL
ncbi:MAG: type I methionyl aminopeptidase [Candidatus Zixiibacteriota bacterium]|nr:MAG: type I methionyl aminopeptidase [candidate division Zixibacteria bacterium]